MAETLDASSHETKNREDPSGLAEREHAGQFELTGAAKQNSPNDVFLESNE